MDIRGSSRLRSARSPTSYRFLGESLHPPLHQNPSPASSAAGDELTEDDIFAAGDFSEHNLHSESSTPSSSSSSTSSRPHNRQSRPGFGPSESFGILAALPENETHSVFNHKASVPASASASRGIPLAPKPPQDRIPSGNSPFSAIKYHQSAPLNVPVMIPKKSMITRRRDLELEGDADVDDKGSTDDEDGPMLPPHEIVARSLAKSQILACSVLEGAGRTLKGRDLRQVRNAVFRQTAVSKFEAQKSSKPKLEGTDYDGIWAQLPLPWHASSRDGQPTLNGRCTATAGFFMSSSLSKEAQGYENGGADFGLLATSAV